MSTIIIEGLSLAAGVFVGNAIFHPLFFKRTILEGIGIGFIAAILIIISYTIIYVIRS